MKHLKTKVTLQFHGSLGRAGTMMGLREMNFFLMVNSV